MPASNRKLRGPLALFVVMSAFVSSGCAITKSSRNAHKEFQAPPALVQQPLEHIAGCFSNMFLSYVAAETGDGDIILEIEPIRNPFGKDLPGDLSPYVRNAVDKIAAPFKTARAWVETPSFAGPIFPSAIGIRPKAPQPSYRITGSVVGYFDPMAKGKNAGIGGLLDKGPVDGQINRDNQETTTSITISLLLEAPDGLTVRGATADYLINIRRTERNQSVSVYVAGNGIGFGSRLTISDDPGAALRDAIVMSVTHLLGNAYLVPFWRCDSAFSADHALSERFHASLNRKTRQDLEQFVKRHLYLSGFEMDLSTPLLTPDEQALVIEEMRRRSLDFEDRPALMDYAFDLWSHLDYVKAAKRVEDRIALVERERREAAASPVDWHISPREFNWPEAVSMVVLDLGRVTDEELRKKIIAVVRQCEGCREVRLHGEKALAGIRTTKDPAYIQSALRLSGVNLQYLWIADTYQQQYLVVKLKP